MPLRPSRLRATWYIWVWIYALFSHWWQIFPLSRHVFRVAIQPVHTSSAMSTMTVFISIHLDKHMIVAIFIAPLSGLDSSITLEYQDSHNAEWQQLAHDSPASSSSLGEQRPLTDLRIPFRCLISPYFDYLIPSPLTDKPQDTHKLNIDKINSR